MNRKSMCSTKLNVLDEGPLCIQIKADISKDCLLIMDEIFNCLMKHIGTNHNTFLRRLLRTILIDFCSSDDCIFHLNTFVCLYCSLKTNIRRIPYMKWSEYIFNKLDTPLESFKDYCLNNDYIVVWSI